MYGYARMNLRLFGLLTAASLAVASVAYAQQEIERTASPSGARLYIISPSDGQTLSNPVIVRFGLAGMGIAPAGIEFPGAGHHHLMLDTALPDLDKPIPADDHHRHFGRGQSEVALELSPGVHSLQLLLGDRDHVPHLPPVFSEKIQITVE